MLGKVIVYNQHVLSLIHEILAHGAARIRCNVLQRCRFRRCCSNNNGILHRTVLAQLFHKVGNCRSLLSDCYIDADNILPFLIQDGIHSNRCLPRLTISDDQLPLSSSNRNHGINCLNPCLQRFLYRLPIQNAGCRRFHRPILPCVNRTGSVNWLTDCIYNPADHGFSNRDRHNASGSFNRLPLSDSRILAEQHSRNTGLLQILRHSVGSVLKFQKLSGHTVHKAADSGNTIAHRKNCSGFTLDDRVLVILDLAADYLGNFFWF